MPPSEASDAAAPVGVVIGRFQVADLHAGHRALIAEVARRHGEVLVLVGVGPLPSTARNPLSFEIRRDVITSAFPAEVRSGAIAVFELDDHPDDDFWSRRVDEAIAAAIGPDRDATLYGSRDSFADGYSGRFDVELLPHVDLGSSGTAHRAEVAAGPHDSSFARGAIWANLVQYPTVFSTVDVAILRDDQVLLCRKPDAAVWGFVGGFADPSSPDDETDAVREAFEETGLEVEITAHLGSANIDDWRYRSERDLIRTHFFVAAPTDDREPVAHDDVAEVRWFSMGSLERNPEQVQVAHHVLLARLQDHLRRG